MSDKKVITTTVKTKISIKLPNELATHPHLSKAKVDVNDELITFVLPPTSQNICSEIWQYIHQKQTWAVVTFTS